MKAIPHWDTTLGNLLTKRAVADYNCQQAEASRQRHEKERDELDEQIRALQLTRDLAAGLDAANEQEAARAVAAAAGST